MTSKEKRQINHILFCQIVAGTRNVDKTKMLNAFAFDLGEMLNGEEPTASRQLNRSLVDKLRETRELI